MNKRNKKDFKEKKKSLSIQQESYPATNPEKDNHNTGSDYFQSIAYRDLQFKGNIETYANPLTSPDRAGYPYQLIGSTNRVTEVKYSEPMTIMGNNLTEFPNSTESKFLNSVDLCRAIFRLRYLYLTYHDDDSDENKNNMGYNFEMMKAFTTALATTESTMFTQLSILSDRIWHSMPYPHSISDEVVAGRLTDNERGTYDLLALCAHYQSVLQNIVSPVVKYNQTMRLINVAKDMSYGREEPSITKLSGLLKKKAFITALEGISTTLSSEYFDMNWYLQTNVLTNVPSRKDNAMDSALTTAIATHEVPRVKIFPSNAEVDEDGSSETTPYYDSDKVLTVRGIFANPWTFTIDGTSEKPITLSFEEVVLRLNMFLDINTMLAWARQNNSGQIPAGSSLTTEVRYFDQIVYLAEAVNKMGIAFTTNMANLRTLFEKLKNTNMLYWKKNLSFKLPTGFDQVTPTYNKMLADLISSSKSGAAEMTWDTETRRWKAHTLWDKFTGIPKYDLYTGGSFLTFSTRRMPAFMTAFNDDTVTAVPLLFSDSLRGAGYPTVQILLNNRFGTEYEVQSTYDEDIRNNPVLSRLDPLNSVRGVKIPYVALDEHEETNGQMSALIKTLVDLFKYGTLMRDGEVIVTNCSNDLVAFIDFEVDAVSNAMMQYARNYSPFRVSTKDGSRTIGFSSGK